MMDKSEYGEKVTKQGALTNWRPQRKGQIRTRKESNQAWGTHHLETVEGGISQDMESKQPSEEHSRSGDHRGRDESRHGKEATEHSLSGNHRGRTSQDMERTQLNKRYSLPETVEERQVKAEKDSN